VFTPQGAEHELVHLIDVITTNKTDFFREAGHFDYLVSKRCPTWRRARRQPEVPGLERRLLHRRGALYVGHGPQRILTRAPGFRFNVLATDICTDVLAKAAMGIFKSEVVKPVPQDLRRKYFMRSRDPESDVLRVVPEVRALVEFRRVNFMDADFGLPEAPEIIFCRNVIIYFDRPTQVRILEKLTRQLAPGGYFFAGHSESLQGMDLPLVPVAPSVYRKPR
jgi:chemotaxis protein methyltransferase CheR